ncbi:DinB family protein [Streptomyces sp. NRRL F-525]|uniref:DinB family protein n=1 Tax=Streptomyces sp. NRRL F-525 TaxID=1463861 RepID=UPI0005253FA2|nr:DinB family protein [Streptomyces sp. NRRL F-525]
MTRSERLADQLDWYWQKNLRPRLDGLTDEEYFWEPVRGCWNIRPRGTSDTPMSEGSGEWTRDFASPGPVPSPVTTIAWRLAHIVVSCLGYRVGWHFGGQDMESETFAYAGVRKLSDADLENPPAVGPERFPMEGIVLHVNRELIAHGAEISLLRDLYLWQDGAAPHRV